MNIIILLLQFTLFLKLNEACEGNSKVLRKNRMFAVKSSLSKLKPLASIAVAAKSLLEKVYDMSNSLIETLQKSNAKQAKVLSKDSIGQLIEKIKTAELKEVDEMASKLGYVNLVILGHNLPYYAFIHKRVDLFRLFISKGFSPDMNIPEFNIPLYRFIIETKTSPERDNMLRTAYEHSKKMIPYYYNPKYKKSGWHADAIEAMKKNDFIFIERLLQKHNAHPENVMLTEGLFIHSAVINDCPNCVRAILKAGADVNSPFPFDYELTNTLIEDKDTPVEIYKWTPLMIACAKGNKRVIDALLESPKIEITRGLPSNKFYNARQVARFIQDEKFRKQLLNRIHARPADVYALDRWLSGTRISTLSLENAIIKQNRSHVEYLLINTVPRPPNIQKQLFLTAIEKSSAEILDILKREFGTMVLSNKEVELTLKRSGVDSKEKYDILTSYLDEN